MNDIVAGIIEDSVFHIPLDKREDRFDHRRHTKFGTNVYTDIFVHMTPIPYSSFPLLLLSLLFICVDFITLIIEVRKKILILLGG